MSVLYKAQTTVFSFVKMDNRTYKHQRDILAEIINFSTEGNIIRENRRKASTSSRRRQTHIRVYKENNSPYTPVVTSTSYTTCSNVSVTVCRVDGYQGNVQ